MLVLRHPIQELALATILITGIDVADGDSLHRDDFGSLDYDDMMLQCRVNTLGPLRVTEALRDNLAAGSKVAIITSRVGSIADNSSGGHYGYRASKTALNQVGVNLMHNLSMENTGGFWHAEGYELPW